MFSLDFTPLLPYWPTFLLGAWLTLKMTCVAVFFGLILGMIVAFAKRAKVPVLTRVCILYIEAVRNTDAVFLGVLAATRALQDSGELSELRVTPAAGLSAQFAFVTLEGRTEAPALRLVREFCVGLAQAGADQPTA